jgi:ribosomal protein S18 acetylase RimI-like enzyme
MSVVDVTIRQAGPGDYDAVAALVDDWWGRPIRGSLPRLFFDLFFRTSLVADGPAGPAGFLIGILSPSDPEDAYIHFVGVAPQARKTGLARALYERFFDLARADGRSVVRAVTAPVNSGSIAFHAALGFSVTGPVTGYDGPGRDLMAFRRAL